MKASPEKGNNGWKIIDRSSSRIKDPLNSCGFKKVDIVVDEIESRRSNVLRDREIINRHINLIRNQRSRLIGLALVISQLVDWQHHLVMKTGPSLLEGWMMRYKSRIDHSYH